MSNTFAEKYKRGEIGEERIHDYIEKWHETENNDTSLHEYLGLDREEYKEWVESHRLPERYEN